MKNNRSVERALSILLYVCQSERSCGLTEISQATELDKATTLRLLKTLADSDMVCFEPGTRRYLRGPGIYNFWPSEMRKICRPHISRLVEQVNETICIIVPKGNERVCIDAVEPERELRIVAPVGRELPVFFGASGRILMAYKTEQQVESILDDYEQSDQSSEIKIDKKKYLEEVKETLKTGYAYNVGEVATDTSTIAAPIFDGIGNTAAVLVLRCPSTRMLDENLDEMIRLIKITAQQITNELTNINT